VGVRQTIITATDYAGIVWCAVLIRRFSWRIQLNGIKSLQVLDPGRGRSCEPRQRRSWMTVSAGVSRSPEVQQAGHLKASSARYNPYSQLDGGPVPGQAIYPCRAHGEPASLDTCISVGSQFFRVSSLPSLQNPESWVTPISCQWPSLLTDT
jgi:hypothetical protein